MKSKLQYIKTYYQSPIIDEMLLTHTYLDEIIDNNDFASALACADILDHYVLQKYAFVRDTSESENELKMSVRLLIQYCKFYLDFICAMKKEQSPYIMVLILNNVLAKITILKKDKLGFMQHNNEILKQVSKFFPESLFVKHYKKLTRDNVKRIKDDRMVQIS